MLAIEAAGTRLCDGVSRRELLRFGGLGALSGLTGVLLPATRCAGASTDAALPRGRAKSLLFISLFGGPSHHDIWDMKPDAPAEIRGEFQPIATNVPGIRITEHLPQLARMADRYALVRSVTHLDNGHGSAMYAAFTGWAHPMPNTNPIPGPDDYPAFGAALGRVRPPAGALPAFVAVGGAQIVCGNQIPGQRAGFLGPGAEPFVVQQDPNRPDFSVPELAAPKAIPALRLDRRRSLLEAVEHAARAADRSRDETALDSARQRAFDLLGSRSVREALDLSREPAPVRDRFGRTTFGQSLVLGRRLLQAGVPYVNVNWARGGNWDNHGNIFPSLKRDLLPPFDHSFSALLQDLTDHGLLESTLVVAAGEFGRTPQINKDAGRDHWAGVYTVVLAGGGIHGGRVHGTSDATGTYPASDAVAPWDIAATIYHCLGVPPDAELPDRFGRPLRLCKGEPIRSLL